MVADQFDDNELDTSNTSTGTRHGYQASGLTGSGDEMAVQVNKRGRATGESVPDYDRISNIWSGTFGSGDENTLADKEAGP